MEPLQTTPRSPVQVEAPRRADEPPPIAPAESPPSSPDTDTMTPEVIHDLREPLRSIRLVTGFLREDRPDMDEATARSLGRIDQLAQRADRLVTALADHERLGRQELRPEATDLNDLVREVIWDLERQRVAAPGEVSLVAPLPRSRCDRSMVARALHELASNGLLFNRSAPRRVEIGTAASDPPTLYVRDNGIGIPPRRLGDVFRMFARLHPRDDFGGGIGAGLAIARRIIERHGGKIWASSGAGEGSTFFFTLPPRV